MGPKNGIEEVEELKGGLAFAIPLLLYLPFHLMLHQRHNETQLCAFIPCNTIGYHHFYLKHMLAR